MDTPWRIRHVQKRDWGHHPAEKDQLLEFLKISSPPFDCWAIDVDHSSSEQSINLSQRHNRADETIRMSVTAPSTKLFFPIGRQRRNSVVNSNSSLDGRRCTSGHFQPQFLLRETKGPNRKKNGWTFFFPFYFCLPFRMKEIYDSSLFIVRMGLQWNWPEVDIEWNSTKNSVSWRISEAVIILNIILFMWWVGGLNKRCTSSNASNLTRLNATPKSFFFSWQ